MLTYFAQLLCFFVLFFVLILGLSVARDYIMDLVDTCRVKRIANRHVDLFDQVEEFRHDFS